MVCPCRLLPLARVGGGAGAGWGEGSRGDGDGGPGERGLGLGVAPWFGGRGIGGLETEGWGGGMKAKVTMLMLELLFRNQERAYIGLLVMGKWWQE